MINDFDKNIYVQQAQSLLAKTHPTHHNELQKDQSSCYVIMELRYLSNITEKKYLLSLRIHFYFCY